MGLEVQPSFNSIKSGSDLPSIFVDTAAFIKLGFFIVALRIAFGENKLAPQY